MCFLGTGVLRAECGKASFVIICLICLFLGALHRTSFCTFGGFCILRILYIQPTDTAITMVFVISLTSWIPLRVCWKGPWLDSDNCIIQDLTGLAGLARLTGRSRILWFIYKTQYDIYSLKLVKLCGPWQYIKYTKYTKIPKFTKITKYELWNLKI